MNNPTRSHHTKHIDVEFRFIRQLIQSDKISIRHIGTEEQYEDVMTKPLDDTKLERQVKAIMHTV